MQKIIKQITKKRGEYQRITPEQRTQVIWYKAQGLSLKKISELTGVKEKTAQSMQHDKRQSCYQYFIDEVIRTYLQEIINEPRLQLLNDKQQKNFVKEVIIKEFNYETSQFQHLLAHKKKSNRDRILIQVVDEILVRYHQHFIKKQLDEFLNPQIDSQSFQDSNQFILLDYDFDNE